MSIPAGPLQAQDPPRHAALEARDLTVIAGGRALISSLSLALRPGELVALIGPSGAGKTTLLRALSGSAPIHGGSVVLRDGAGAEIFGAVGYVPSDDLIHDQLTVVEELLFAAALRAPSGMRDDELGEMVERVMGDLNLTDLADQRVALLSKGERRRTSVAVELVGQPDVLLLDEPGSGLDAGLERRLMRLLRGLADQGRAVLAATHATASLSLCDRVAVLGRGGGLQCVGTIAEVLAHFGVDSVEEVYERLEELASRPGAGEDRSARPTVAPQRPRVSAPRLGFSRQLEIITQRGAICRLRDRRSLAILIGQAPILALAIGFVLPHDAIQNADFGPYYGVLLAFLLLTACTWLGTISSCREIVSEIGILRRELAVGLRYDAYLLAKCLTMLPLVVIQTGILAVVVLAVQPVSAGAALVVVGCMATGLASACIGLWLSAWSRTIDVAIASTPLIMIPQLLLAGALIPVNQLPAPLRLLADIFVGHWSFNALGSAIGLGNSLGSSLVGVTGLTQTSFPNHPIAPIATMLGIGAVAVVLAGVQLSRRINLAL